MFKVLRRNPRVGPGSKVDFTGRSCVAFAGYIQIFEGYNMRLGATKPRSRSHYLGIIYRSSAAYPSVFGAFTVMRCSELETLVIADTWEIFA